MKTTFKDFLLEMQLFEEEDRVVYRMPCYIPELREDSYVALSGILMTEDDNWLVGLKGDLLKIGIKYGFAKNDQKLSQKAILFDSMEVAEEYKATHMIAQLGPKDVLQKLIARLNKDRLPYAVKLLEQSVKNPKTFNVLVIHDKMEDPRDLPQAGGHEEVPHVTYGNGTKSYKKPNHDVFYFTWPDETQYDYEDDPNYKYLMDHLEEITTKAPKERGVLNFRLPPPRNDSIQIYPSGWVQRTPIKRSHSTGLMTNGNQTPICHPTGSNAEERFKNALAAAVKWLKKNG